MAGASSGMAGATAIEFSMCISATYDQPSRVTSRSRLWMNAGSAKMRSACAGCGGCEISVDGLGVLLDVVFHADFSGGILRTHVTHFPEDRSLGSPRPIVAAEAPEDSAVGVRIAAVQTILVVELD